MNVKDMNSKQLFLFDGFVKYTVWWGSCERESFSVIAFIIWINPTKTTTMIDWRRKTYITLHTKQWIDFKIIFTIHSNSKVDMIATLKSLHFMYIMCNPHRSILSIQIHQPHHHFKRKQVSQLWTTFSVSRRYGFVVSAPKYIKPAHLNQ